MEQLVVVYVTINNVSNAQKLACDLLEKRLVACVNIVPVVQSWYVWEEKIAHEDEIVMLMKTVAHNYQELEQEILLQHPYQVPCIVKIPVYANQSYMDFVARAVK